MKKIFNLLILATILNAKSLSNQIEESLLTQFPDLNIKHIELQDESLNNCELKDVPRLNSTSFVQVDCDGLRKTARFKIDATKRIYRFKKDMKRYEKVTFFDLKIDELEFNKVPANALKFEENIILKNNVKIGDILKSSSIMPNYLINKNDNVVGILDDGDLSIFVDLIALQSGVKGQKIRLKNNSGKNLWGEVINEKQVKIK